jgi:polyhydroxyalkanoate synthesis repressor PhaR
MMSRRDMTPGTPLLVKKYSNRRLYDTADSQYITLEQLAERVKSGMDVRVVDAQTGEDLTQTTLTQVVIEGRGAARLLPAPLLLQLIRMGDEARAEFLGRYMALALAAYLQARQGLEAIAPFNPFAQVPLQASGALARMMMAAPWAEQTFGNPFAQQVAPVAAQQPAPRGEHAPRHAPASGGEPHATPPAGQPGGAAASPPATNSDVAQLRRELEELKRAMRKRRR